MNEPTPDDNAKSEPAIAPETTEALKKIVEEQRTQKNNETGEKIIGEKNLQKIFEENYIPHNDPENMRRGEIRESQPGVHIAQYETNGVRFTYIVNPGVEGASGHSYDPDNPNFEDLQAKFESLDIDPSKTTVIVEGRAASKDYPSYEIAIAEETESGALVFLAKEAGVERIISGEPDAKELRDSVAEKGYDRKDIALLDVLRSIPTAAAGKPDFDLGLHIYTIAARDGVEGFTELTDEQKEKLIAEGPDAVAKVQDQMREQAKLLIEGFNSKLGKELFYSDENGIIKLQVESNLTDQTSLDAELQPLHSQDSDGPLAKVATEMSAQRDAILNEKILAEVKAGRDVVITFGGSHFDALQGVFEEEFDSATYPGWQPAESTKDSILAEQELSDRKQRDKIFSKFYADSKSTYYKETNQARVDKANTPGAQKIKVNQFGEEGRVTVIAQIKIDEQTGRVVDGHDYNPEAQSHKELEKRWQIYIESTPPEERVVIAEGMPMDERFFISRSAAIRDSKRGDGGITQLLAKDADVEVIFPERSTRELAELMVKEGVSLETSALFFVFRGLAANYNNEKIPDDISMYFYPVLAELGLGEAIAIPEDQKQEYSSDPSKMRELKDKVAPFVPQWNEILTASGLPPLVIGEDGSISFSDDPRFENSITYNILLKTLDSGKEDPLANAARVSGRMRDRMIFESIAQATQSGKKPFVVYGGSHVVSLEPVLKQYYGSQRVLE